MLCIAVIYIARLRITSLNFAKATKDLSAASQSARTPGVINPNGALGTYALVDHLFMQGVFEAGVYMFNL